VGIGERHRGVGRAESTLVGRQWELAAVKGMLDRAIDGHGAVVGVVGSPGIGKSRLVREVSVMAASRGVEVFPAFCESHTSQVPFHAIARLLRAATGVEALDAQLARDRLRERVSDADPEDLLLFDDLLGIADPDAVLPRIDPDARRRRLTALVNAASLARESAAVYVIEDAHWIDAVSESMLADFLAVIPQTASLVILTYRPEYEGTLTRVHGAQTVALAPLRDSETAALITELRGPDPSVGELGQTIVERAAGNPFFAEEIVRELADRGVLQGNPGAYISTLEAADVNVPATLQATIAARIDRLDPKAKRTLGAAAVVGSRFGLDLLTGLSIEPVVDDLVAAQLIDQVRFTRQPEYVFHHPLIRRVAYESQLKSDRAELHRRLAALIQEGNAESIDENAVLVAEHLESAGDVHAAYSWHMRAATWATNRDIAAAWVSWEAARRVADALPGDDPDALSIRIAPRALLCSTAVRSVHEDISTRFEELRELCAEAGDKASLAVGMAGLVLERMSQGRVLEASQLASECMALAESVGDPNLTVGLSGAACVAKFETAEIGEALRYCQMAVDFCPSDPGNANMILGSPLTVALTLRGVCRLVMGLDGWRDDFDRALPMVRTTDTLSLAVHVAYKYVFISRGLLLADDAALREIGEALQVAERSSDDIALVLVRIAQGVALVQRGGEDRQFGFEVLAALREKCIEQQYALNAVPLFDVYAAREKAEYGDLDGALRQLRATTNEMFKTRHLGNRTLPCQRWWRHCWPTAAMVTSRKSKPQSTGLRGCPLITLRRPGTSRCYNSKSCSSKREVTNRPIATIGTATVRWPRSLDMRDI
jgi:hypothetical protein